ncbi:alpha/beta-Hydrolases superfamily protein [Zea mays]|uniref:Alpha/beta-Hydrolases superfamily protein n=1 Tax=Zea mays TaxID=4577 RepID=A0A1D6KB99_MAIZE|nr:alpha/beta-Hydrolases superfamily protein [Zea mays]
MASKPRAFAKVFLPALPPPPLLTAPVFSRRPTNRGAGAAAMSAAAAAPAQAPRKWEGLVDEVLEREVLAACLDQAPERRRIREAFKDVQLSIDHCLFKVNPSPYFAYLLKIQLKGQYSGIRTKEVIYVILQHKFISCISVQGVARKIASAGYGVFALDYPGFGLSEGLHGYIPSFDTLVDDVAEHFSKVKGNPEYRGLPSFLFGQSMGGAVALKVHFKQPNEWNGAILVAPMCKIADDVVPPWPIQQLLIFMAKLLPKEKLVPQKDLAELAFKEKKKQEQCSFNVIAYKDKPRLRTALEMLRTTQEIERRLEEVSLPLIILHGEADMVTDPAVSKALYEKAKSQDKKLCLYKGAYHAILEGEPDQTIFQVLDDIISWLDQHSTKEGISL